MSQNPFGQQQQGGQQQGGFGQQQGGFGQQQSPFGQQPYGQQGFGGASGFNQPIQPQKKGGGAFRTCLIVTLLIVVCCGVCIGGSAAYLLQNKPMAAAFMWTAQAGQGKALETKGIVCEGSPAETFSVLFDTAYPGVTAINYDPINDAEVSGDQYIIKNGQMIYDEGTVDFTATFTIDPDGEGNMGPFGCVESIEFEVIEDSLTPDTDGDTDTDPTPTEPSAS
jgi:hypothetical protein